MSEARPTAPLLPGFPGRIGHYARLIRLERPIGTVLLAWPALWSLWIAAEGMPPTSILAVFLAGAFLARSAGCAINDYFDRDIDPYVARTRDRPLASGALHPWEALLVAGLLFALAFLLALRLNHMTLLLAPPALLLAVLYPLMKRVTYLPQLFLGVAFSWSVPMAFTAVTETLPAATWLLFSACVCWTVAYDTEYAMADREDDRRTSIGSTALLLGYWDRAAVALLHAASLVLLAALGTSLDYSLAYYLCLLLAGLHAAWQQYLVRSRNPRACIRAFASNGWFGLVIFIGIVATTTLD